LDIETEKRMRAILQNVWNIGGLVGIADLDKESQHRLGAIVEENAIAELAELMGLPR